MHLELSIIVPCYGRPELTRRLLESLAASPHQFEVVVVDDATPQSLEPIVAPFKSRLNLKYLRQPIQRGPAAARNLGVRGATYDTIAFTDNDCIVAPDWALELFIQLRDAPARVAGVGGRVLAATDDVYSRYFVYHKILDPFLQAHRYLYLVTANCAFRRSALEEVEGFDEEVRHPGGEDPGLCFKLLGRGYELRYHNQAVVFHHFRMGLRDFARTFYRYGLGCRLQTDKHARDLMPAEGEAAAEIHFGGLAMPQYDDDAG